MPASAWCASPATPPHHNRRVGDFLKREAQRDLDAASRRYAEALDVTIKRISVRDQSSRWGSCSSTGVLSFSWRLILAPPFVLDYLAAHEVAHLVELNHSPRFWRLLKRLNPDTERAKAWLDTHGTDLHRYGAPVKASAATADSLWYRRRRLLRHLSRLRGEMELGQCRVRGLSADSRLSESPLTPTLSPQAGRGGARRRRGAISALKPPFAQPGRYGP